MKNLLRLLSFVPGIRNLAIISTILNLLFGLLGVISPNIFKAIIDRVTYAASHQGVTAADTRAVFYLLAGYVGLQLVSSITHYITELTSSKLVYRTTTELRDQIFVKLSTLSIDYFENQKIGEILQRVESGVSQTVNWLDSITDNVLATFATLVFALAFITFHFPLVGLIMTASTVIFYYLQIKMLRQTRPLVRTAQTHLEQANGFVSETVSHIATVRSFGGERALIDRQRESLDEYHRLRYFRDQIQQRSVFWRINIRNLAATASIGIVVYGALRGRNTVGDILLVSLYAQQINSNIGPLGRAFIMTGEIDVSAERVVTMLETNPTVQDDKDAVALDRLESIEFRNISFAYPGKKRRVLNGVSFTLTPGQTLALVGPSGTGKTTLTKLLLRFYEPSSGEILINGQPIEHFTGASVREHIGMVMQDVALFNDTIEANLQLAAPTASRAAVRAAATQAHADTFIEKLSEKYKTIVGERGVKLSGGEKQRVAIARAILKSPNLIILDEATSALDSESEKHVQAGLHELMEGRTAVVIAHRLSTVMQADQILVMRGGQIVERGTHTELATLKGGLYAKLFKLQTEGLRQ